MKVANPFIQERTEPLQEYFEKLSKVDDVDDTVQVTLWLSLFVSYNSELNNLCCHQLI
jgi:hypothetical protein